MTCRVSAIVGLIVLLGTACMPERERPYGSPSEMPRALDQGTEVSLSEAYFTELPDCVTLLPTPNELASDTGKAFAGSAILEAALTRHARDRFPRVIGGPERRRLVDRLLVDLTIPEDRAYFANRIRCRHFLTFAPWGGADLYAVTYSRKAVGIDARLIGTRDSQPLWQARHIAVRSDGALPLSPLGALIGAFEAARLESDPDLPESMADDVARRLIATLPDLGMAASRTETAPGGVLGYRPATMDD